MVPANDRAWDKLVTEIAGEHAGKFSPPERSALRFYVSRRIGVAEDLIEPAFDATLGRLRRAGKLAFDHEAGGWAPPNWRELREKARLAKIAEEEAAEEQRIAEFSKPGLTILEARADREDFLERRVRLRKFREHPGFAHSYDLSLGFVIRSPNAVADVVAQFEPEGGIVFDTITGELHFWSTQDATQYRLLADHQMEAI